VKNYFVYLPAESANSVWGCVATSAGFTQTQPGSPYPPQRHPLDHHFDWDQGRVLQNYQIILITAGAGTFESAAIAGRQAVGPGSVLLLFPGVWHRYKPDPETGWVEHWIECRGSVFDAAAAAGLIQPTRGLLDFGSTSDLRACFERCHGLAQQGALANQDLLSTLGLHMLALLGHLRRPERGLEKAIDEVVERARARLALRCDHPLELPALATELGISYSHLRHSFTARLGVSPKQYYLNARLEKAQDLLLNTSQSVKEVAEILGFESAFYLSKQFKSRYGRSPKAWRAEMASRRFQARPGVT
jgi:AraC-like DNA-binding protein